MLLLDESILSVLSDPFEAWMSTVFGKRLLAARSLRELTQTDVGLKAGFSEAVAATRISQYERGVHIPPFGVAEQLAKAVDVPTAYFYAKDDQLADWILAFAKTSASARRSIIDKAGI